MRILLLALLGEMYTSMGAKLDFLDTVMTSIEEQVFREREKEMVFEISKVSQRLIAFRQTLYVHETALNEMKTGMETAFGKAYLPRVVSPQ